MPVRVVLHRFPASLRGVDTKQCVFVFHSSLFLQERVRFARRAQIDVVDGRFARIVSSADALG